MPFPSLLVPCFGVSSSDVYTAFNPDSRTHRRKKNYFSHQRVYRAFDTVNVVNSFFRRASFSSATENLANRSPRKNPFSLEIIATFYSACNLAEVQRRIYIYESLLYFFLCFPVRREVVVRRVFMTPLEKVGTVELNLIDFRLRSGPPAASATAN